MATTVVSETVVKIETMVDMGNTGARLRLAAALGARCPILTGLATQAASHRQADKIVQEKLVEATVALIYPARCRCHRLCF
jgi:hypothetical protein